MRPITRREYDLLRTRLRHEAIRTVQAEQAKWAECERRVKSRQPFTDGFKSDKRTWVREQIEEHNRFVAEVAAMLDLPIDEALQRFGKPSPIGAGPLG
jgi:hypothetical protein